MHRCPPQRTRIERDPRYDTHQIQTPESRRVASVGVAKADLPGRQMPDVAAHVPALRPGTATATVMVAVNSGAAATEVPAHCRDLPAQDDRQAERAEERHEPVEFRIPRRSGAYSPSACWSRWAPKRGGGIGPKKDVVAFNYFCTHQGGDLTGSYKADTKSLGACPLHLSTYDLTRHGILISGQAYQSLPQVLLELDGDDIYAVGVFGLIYRPLRQPARIGRHDAMSTPYYIPETNVPLPAQGRGRYHHGVRLLHRRLRLQGLPLAGGRQDRMAAHNADQNAFGADFPVEVLGPLGRAEPAQRRAARRRAAPCGDHPR